jgi:uncharacterized membrane protein
MSEQQKSHEADHESHNNRHMLLMALCCLMPVITVAALSAFFPGNAYIGFLAFLICPLSMLLMHLPNMLSRKKKTEKHEQSVQL